MCGIAAVTGSNTLERAQAAIAMLSHRGPDGIGIWQSESGDITLAHSRLSTIDFLNGAQPVSNEDDSIVAVVNGEFYDCDGVRSRLESRGHQFRSRTDSELLVHLYEEHGVACLDFIHGEFAFVLWHKPYRTLFAARDRFGAKPLYYSEQDNELVIASEIKGLIAAGIAVGWNDRGFLEQLVFQSCLSGKTLYTGILELPPAHLLVMHRGITSVRPYWDMDYPPAEGLAVVRSDDSYALDLRQVLFDAVASRLKSEVPAACYLSGGIDSSCILGLMSQISSSPVDSFCVSFDDPAYDEFDFAARSAARFGSRLTKVPVTPQTLCLNFRDTIWHSENLLHNANAVAKFSLSRAVHLAGYRIVLTGEGADELFGGYPHFVADSLRGGSQEDLLELATLLGLSEQALARIMNPIHQNQSVRCLERLGFSPMWLEGCYWMAERLRSVLPDAFADFELDERLLESLDTLGQLRGRSALNQSLYIHTKTCLSGVTLSTLGDRAEMAHAVEGRQPFLDYRVFNFARMLPTSQKVRKGTEKFILRKAVRDLVGPEGCGRRKQPFAAPPALWERGSVWGELLQDTLRSHSLERIPFVKKSALRDLLDQDGSVTPLERQALEAPLMAIASACHLSELFSLS